MDEFEKYGLEDYDAELLNREDYVAVLQLRENQLKKYPSDYWTRYKWAEILELTGKYGEALKVLSALHHEEPEDEDTITIILDCLRKTNQSANGYKWKKKPEISYLNEDMIDNLSKYLKGKRKNKRTIESIYLHFLMAESYPFFDEEELYLFLKQANRVDVKGDQWYNAWIEKIEKY